MVWLHRSVLSRCGSHTSWLSRVSGKHTSGDRVGQWDKRTVWTQGCLEEFYQRRAAVCQSRGRAQRAAVLGLVGLTEFLFLLPKISWAETHGWASHVAHLFGALSLAVLSTVSCLLSFYSASSHKASQSPCQNAHGDCSYHMVRKDSLVPSTPLLTRHFLCLLPMRFYFRATCQVTHLSSRKSFPKTLGSRPLPCLSCHSFIIPSEHLHWHGIHRINT